MQNFYIHGHGIHQVNNGFVKVPANFMVSFYTDYAKLLSWSTVQLILENPNSVPAMRTVGEYKMVPNLTYMPLPAGDRQRARNRAAAGMRVMFFDQTMTLGAILAGVDGQMGARVKQVNTGARVGADIAREAAPEKESIHLHWLCCQAVSGLADQGGGMKGFNAADRRHQIVPRYQCTFRNPVTNQIETINQFLPMRRQ